MQLLDGKKCSAHILDELKIKVAQLAAEGKKVPHLAAILIGNDPASETYVGSKVRTCKNIGYKSTLIKLEDTVSEFDLLEIIKDINSNPDIDGVIVQLPLPKHISTEKVINEILPAKDVDGFHPINVGRLVQGSPCFVSATPHGISLLLDYYHISTAGKHAVIIGRSNIVGRPLSILLSQPHSFGNCTVTLCHSKTENLKDICYQADIIIAAIGNPEYLKADLVKDGTIVIDVGVNRILDASKKSGFTLKGDVDFANVAPKCSYITPVPGGVGLMTVAALMKNTFQAYSNLNEF